MNSGLVATDADFGFAFGNLFNMNNNLTTERAIRNVFMTSSYITIGDKEKPLEFNKKQPQRSCFKTKQFMTNPPKQGVGGAKVPEVYLDRTHNWVDKGSNFTDKIWYKDLQKEKKKGFLTGDFKRRDEFSLNFTTEQYRERLKDEARYQKLGKYKELRSLMEGELATGQAVAEQKPAKLLFDLVYDSDDPQQQERVKHTKSDTKNPTRLSYNRNYGPSKTSSNDIGYGIHEAHHGKPEFARIPLVKSTFYRPSTIPITNCIYTQRPN